MYKSNVRICIQILYTNTLAWLIIIFAVSCSNTKDLRLINDIPDSSRIQLPKIEVPTSTIQPDDILEIKITGKNEATVLDFNSKGGGYEGSSGKSINYLVDKDGFVEIFKIGKVKAAGFTLGQFKENLVNLLQPELLEANAIVRYVNFRFTVLGEVKLPTTFTVPNEKITILEALGYAGDMTNFAKKSNVRVIRDSAGYREIGLVNFTQKSLFTSPYFYLRRNDVIIVDADIKSKKSTETIAKTSSIIGLVTGLLTIAYLMINRNR